MTSETPTPPARPEAPPARQRARPVPAAGMRHSFTAPWQRILDWLFGPVRFPEEAAERLRDLSKRGTLVYISRKAGLLPYLYFNWAFRRLGLPLAHYVNGVGPGTARLFGRGLAPAQADRDQPGGRLAATVAAGHPALIFLWRRARALTGRRDSFPADQAAALVRLQRTQARPVLVVPILLLFGSSPGRKGARPSVLDVLFGPREAPGRLRALLTFLRFRKRAWVKVGEPIDLAAGEAFASASDGVLGRKVRGVVGQYLAREARSVTGPGLKDPKRLQWEILRDVRLRDVLAEIAHDEGRRLTDVRKEARKDLQEIASRYSPLTIAVMDRLLRIVFQRIYDGIEVDEAGLSRIREASRKGPVVLCPTHRSHMDYLVLSWMFYQKGLAPPHIAAGKNLSFWPLGPILRRGGAYFLRRSFKGDRIYSAVFRAYVRKLMQEGYSQEFFIEGTRSRTGKMLPPRLGMVAYELDAFLESARADVQFVPVSIGYTRVIEAGSYTAELMGGEKSKEDVRSLLKAGQVLRRRYGRIYIQIGQPLSLAAFLSASGHDRSAGEVDRRRVTQGLAWELAHRIDGLTTVIPASVASAALLSDRRRGMELTEVVDRAQLLVDLVRRTPGARLAGAMRIDEAGLLDPAPIREAVEALRDEGLVRVHRVARRTVVEILPDGRVGLDYYKNALMSFLASRSIAAHALMSFRGVDDRPAPARRDEALHRAEDLSQSLSREFVFEPGVPVADVFDRLLSEFEGSGWIRRDGDHIQVSETGERPLEVLRQLSLNLVEGYWITAQTAAEVLGEGPVADKELVSRILTEGRILVLTGRIAAAEALSKPMVQAALSAWVDQGVLERGGRRGEVLAAAEPDALRMVEAALAPFVGAHSGPGWPRLPDGGRPPLELAAPGD